MANLMHDKLIICVGMFLATFFFGVVPIKVITWASGRHLTKLLSVCSCFSGGVFMAACLMDLIPDVREAMDNVLDEIEKVYHTKVDYPMAEFVLCLGFLTILIVEQVILECRTSPPSSTLTSPNRSSERTPLFRGGRRSSYDTPATSDTNTDVEVVEHNTHQHRDEEAFAPSSQRQNEAVRPTRLSDHEDHGHGHDHGVADVFEHSTLRAVILCIALCFHSLFEGLAIGLQEDVGELISIFGAVIMHKAVMSFSLGLTLAQSRLKMANFVISLLIFSAASPVGLLIGVVLTDMKRSLARDIANSVLQGISGGTFLYITFFEVLPHEFRGHGYDRTRMIKVLFVLLGFSSICGLLFITH